MSFTDLPTFPAIEELKSRAQWVAWKYLKRGEGKPTKPPVNPHNGYGASHSNPANWADYETARAFAAKTRGIEGVGFVLTEADGVCGIDLDDCRNAETGEVEAWAQEILDLRETYAEVSPSGRGFRLLARGKPDKSYKSDPARVEIYGTQRYLTITGNAVEGAPLAMQEAPQTLALLLARVEAHAVKKERPAPAALPAVGMQSQTRVDPPRSRGSDFFRSVNDAALQNLDPWVSYLFGGSATYYPTTGGYRVSSEALGRSNQEDLSITPQGIKDFGVHDMGDAQAGCRTAIDLVMEHAGAPDAMDAAKWLCDRLGISYAAMGYSDGLSATASARIAERLVAHADGTLTNEKTGEIVESVSRTDAPQTPADLEDMPYPAGLTGEIARWIVDTARWPQKSLAIGAALTIVGTAIGRQYAGPTQSATHLYTVELASTGAGKDHAYKMVTKIMQAAGLGHHLGPSEFISMPSVVNFLMRKPLSVCCIDELGDFLARIGNRKASGFERSISKVMRTMWSSSFSAYMTPEWAGKESVAINSPAMSMFGVSTPEQFWKSLEASGIEDGTVNRFFLVNGVKRPSEIDPKRDPHTVPDEIRKGLRRLYDRSGDAMSALRNQPDIDPSGKLVHVGWTDEAQAMYREMTAFVESQMEADPHLAPLMSRTSETAIRLATILCVGREGLLQISAEDMAYGRELAFRSTQFLIDGAADYVSDSEAQSQAQRIKRIIKKAGGSIMHSHLLRALGHSIRTKDLKDVFTLLQESGEIEIVEVLPEPGHPGRPATWYRMA